MDVDVGFLQRLQRYPERYGTRLDERQRRLPNEVAHEPPLPGWLHLWRCYLKPFNVLLTVLAVLSFMSADSKATVVIAVMVALSTVIRFVQEGRSHRAAESLRAMVRNKATVIRRGAGTAPAVAQAARHCFARPGGGRRGRLVGR